MNSPVDTVRAFYDAVARGDVPAVLSLLDPEVEWTEAERFPYYSGVWRGPDAVLTNLLIPLTRDWDDFAVRPRDFICEGERVVTLGAYSGVYKKTGRSFTAEFAHVWRVQGGKLAKFNMHTDTAKVLEAIQM